MENYTLGLALFDYLPVIAAGFGLYFICKYCAGLASYSGLWIIARSRSSSSVHASAILKTWPKSQSCPPRRSRDQ